MILQTIDWCSLDYYEPDINESNKFIIKAFGRTKENKSIAISITDFEPFFYIKLPEYLQFLTPRTLIQSFDEYIIKNIYYKNRSDYKQSYFINDKYDFWGFQNYKKHNYIKFTFSSIQGWRAGINLFKTNEVKMYNINGNKPFKVVLYESNIEPLLCFFHTSGINPSGWIQILQSQKNSYFPSTCEIDICCSYKNINVLKDTKIQPLYIASFDIECISSHGDFPIPRKDYKKACYELYHLYNSKTNNIDILEEIIAMFDNEAKGNLSKVYPRNSFEIDKNILIRHIDDIELILKGKLLYKNSKYFTVKPTDIVRIEDIINSLLYKFGKYENNEEKSWTSFCEFPKLQGDAIIQIGTTIYQYGCKTCYKKIITTLGECDNIDENTIVHSVNSEADLLLKWQEVILEYDPDILTGYNILGFDFWYLYERAKTLGILEPFSKLGRLQDKECEYKEQVLSSSALGDNLLKYFNIHGRVIIDVMKVVQRDHKLDSYKLDNVANYFLKMSKHDVSPKDICNYQKGTSYDRKVIAEYCLQDCELCNKLIIKLETLTNNIGMSNVCIVPLSYIFTRGQGVKIFSLVANQCKQDNYLIPRISKPIDDNDDDEGYEGAIVLDPKEGMYLDDPISVLDYASLYPSSMISENLSHDCIILDEQYDNIKGYEYVDVSFDIHEKVNNKKRKIGTKICRYVQTPEKGIIPRILLKLLNARKDTRKKLQYKTIYARNNNLYTGYIKEENEELIVLYDENNTKYSIYKNDIDIIKDAFDDFEKAILDGLQLAYKITANSLYGQIGAKTSPIYLKDIAASTTATGRKMILIAKEFVEKQYNGEVIYGDSVTGDTPIIVKYDDNIIDIKSIDTLSEKWVPYNNYKPFEYGIDKEQSFINAYTWTSNGWKKITRIIRHKTNKHMYRVNSFQGCVDVTEDHSLIDINGIEIKPHECKMDTKLMHGFPIIEQFGYKLDIKKAWLWGILFAIGKIYKDDKMYKWEIKSKNIKLLMKISNDYDNCSIEKLSFAKYKLIIDDKEKYKNLLYDQHNYKKIPIQILNGCHKTKSAFMNGYLLSIKNYNIIKCQGKLASQGLYYLMQSLGYENIIITYLKNDKYEFHFAKDIYNFKKYKNNINKIVQLKDTNFDTFVYDIETEDGTFLGGVGKLIVHNTDSIFFRLPNIDKTFNKKYTRHEAIMPSIKVAQELSKELKNILKPPHDAQYEKTFYPFILFSKKRYVGNLYECDDINYKQKSMGIVLKRRDNAPIVKHIYGGCLDIILNKQDIDASIRFLNENLDKLINGKFDINELIITKSLRAEYKNPNSIAHKRLADRIAERDPGNKPQVNDRIPYAYIYVDSKNKLLQGDKIEHPEYIKQHKLTLDYEFYITNQLMKPLCQLYSLALFMIKQNKKTSLEFEILYNKYAKELDEHRAKDKIQELKELQVQKILFDKIITTIKNKTKGFNEITKYYKRA